MQFVTLGNLNRGIELILDGRGKRLARIAAIHQHAGDVLQVGGAPRNRRQGSGPIRHIRRRHRDRMRQPEHVYGNMALDARDLFTGIIAFLLGTLGGLHTLRVEDDKARRGVPPLFAAGLANLIFLMPVPRH